MFDVRVSVDKQTNVGEILHTCATVEQFQRTSVIETQITAFCSHLKSFYMQTNSMLLFIKWYGRLALVVYRGFGVRSYMHVQHTRYTTDFLHVPLLHERHISLSALTRR